MSPIWTDEQDEILRAFYPRYATVDLAFMVGRSPRAVHQRARQIGLSKIVNTGRFVRGQIGWNKGMKGLQMGGVATQFKPGQRPHTTLPIGSMRITKDFTLMRKVSDASGHGSRRWRSVHELVWTAQNGPVPPKHIVVFKPGMWSDQLDDITLERVECISLAENMRRNTKHRLPPELVSLITLRGVLTRQINKRKQPKGKIPNEKPAEPADD